jgi:hypothetical protein
MKSVEEKAATRGCYLRLALVAKRKSFAISMLEALLA